MLVNKNFIYLCIISYKYLDNSIISDITDLKTITFLNQQMKDIKMLQLHDDNYEYHHDLDDDYILDVCDIMHDYYIKIKYDNTSYNTYDYSLLVIYESIINSDKFQKYLCKNDKIYQYIKSLIQKDIDINIKNENYNECINLKNKIENLKSSN